uniref:Leucine-rich repeat-containing N-terminal plant-type domain-containing protein n=1 Tax=Fagus sylvatica TaxID=28930 RepID=A0A2N9GIC9_FAGSY
MASFMCYLMSTRLLVLLPLFLAIATNCFSSMQPLCHDDDSSALLQFKESFDMNLNACRGPFAYPKIASWKQEGMDRDCCYWDGVECDEDTGHVIGLNLNSSCLYGSMVSNSSLFRLVHLQRLESFLQQLQFLSDPIWIQPAFKISSPVPEILSNLSCLTTLQLVDCGLHGEFPVGIFKLPKLQELRVSYNQDLMGYFPEFYSSSPLKILSVRRTSFSGKLPDSIGNLDSLNELLIGNCNFSSHIPSSMANLTQLSFLEMTSTQLTGQIPSWLANMTQLRFDQPLIHFPWPKLEVLDLRSNKLQALPPNPPPSISKYLVANNKLQGEIAPLICTISSPYSLDMSNNKFTGTLPHCLRNFSISLQILNLRGNNFHGKIPQLCANGSGMRMIDLSENQFEGAIPRSLSNCRMLQILNLGSNQLTDVFPSWLGTLLELSVLILRQNELYGLVGSPKTIFASPKLRIVDLSANKFSSELPFEYFRNWKYMKTVDTYGFIYMLSFRSFWLGDFEVYEYYLYSMTIINKGKETMYTKIINIFAAIDLSSNKFNGSIPEFIGDLNGFQLLNLSNNNLTGYIPVSIGDMSTLESLDLSQNKLSGQIPWQLTQLTFLGSFNISHNQLIGPIPHGNQFDTFENSSFDGNPGLCGSPLPNKCESVEPSPLPTSRIEEDQDSWFPIEFDWKIIILGYCSGLINGVVVGNIVTKKKPHWFVRARKRLHKRERRQLC